MSTIRYHIKFISDPKYRTTISLDKIVSDLMAIKLGFKPGTPEAHQAVRKRLNQFVRAGHRDHSKLSQLIAEDAILDIVDNMLSKKYYDWFLESCRG